MNQPKYSPKQIALMKQEFLQSDFGKYAAQKINELYADHHGRAENIENHVDRTAAHINRAAGINEVIQFFTSDVALLEGGYFNEEKEAEPKA